MLMLFVTGVDKSLGIAILSALVLAEKLLPRGRLLSRFAGVAILIWGVSSAAARLIISANTATASSSM